MRLEPLVWDVVVFDEAHALAGPSDRAAAASALGTRARRVVMLTATPHSGDEEAFRRLCDDRASRGRSAAHRVPAQPPRMQALQASGGRRCSG